MPQQDPSWLPLHLLHSHWFPDQLDLGFPIAGSLMSLPIKQFIHDAVTCNPETAGASASEVGPPTKTVTVYPVSLFFLSLLVLPSLSIAHSPRWSHTSSSPLLSKRSAVLCSCCVSQCPLPWLAPIFMPFIIPKVGRSWSLVSGSHQELSLHSCIAI